MHALLAVVAIFVMWSHPVSRALLLIAFVSLLAFALCPPVIAWVIVAVVAVGLWGGAAEEMRAKREWQEDDEMIRRAQVRRARRYLDP